MPDASNSPGPTQKENTRLLAESPDYSRMIARLQFQPGLLAVLLIACLAAVGCQHTSPGNSLATHDASKWEPDILAFEAADRLNPPPRGGIEFVGSSSIRLWKTLGQDFPGQPAFNRGFGGSQLADSVHYADRIIIPYAPRQVVIYTGANDIHAGKSPELVFGDFVALVTRIQQALPETEIAFIAISPNPARWSEVEQVKETNRLVADYCRKRGLAFINTFPLMLGGDGLPKPDIFVEDRLHMNAKGYAIWRAAVAPHLQDR